MKCISYMILAIIIAPNGFSIARALLEDVLKMQLKTNNHKDNILRETDGTQSAKI